MMAIPLKQLRLHLFFFGGGGTFENSGNFPKGAGCQGAGVQERAGLAAAHCRTALTFRGAGTWPLP